MSQSSQPRKRKYDFKAPPRRIRTYRGQTATQAKKNFKYRKSVQPTKTMVQFRPVKNTHQSYMPNAFVTKLTYNATINYTMGVGNYSNNQFRGNSIYDPDYTGTGTTVLGHAELSAIYQRYRVLGSRITVQLASKTSTNGSCHMVVYPCKDSTLPGYNTALNAPNKAECFVDNDGGSGQITHYASTRTMFATQTADDVAFGSAMSANPGNQWFWNWLVLGTSGDTGTCRVCIEYFVLLYDLAPTTPSVI